VMMRRGVVGEWMMHKGGGGPRSAAEVGSAWAGAHVRMPVSVSATHP
jgi:hypothetical protein